MGSLFVDGDTGKRQRLLNCTCWARHPPPPPPVAELLGDVNYNLAGHI